MSQPVATKIVDNSFKDYRRVPVYDVGETITIYFQN